MPGAIVRDIFHIAKLRRQVTSFSHPNIWGLEPPGTGIDGIDFDDRRHSVSDMVHMDQSNA